VLEVDQAFESNTVEDYLVDGEIDLMEIGVSAERSSAETGPAARELGLAKAGTHNDWQSSKKASPSDVVRLNVAEELNVARRKVAFRPPKRQWMNLASPSNFASSKLATASNSAFEKFAFPIKMQLSNIARARGTA
jgi:hypothetical protein